MTSMHEMSESSMEIFIWLGSSMNIKTTLNHNIEEWELSVYL